MPLTRRDFLSLPLLLAARHALAAPTPRAFWQLPGDGVSADSFWLRAKMPMYPVFPRPDSETQAHARHRWAHPDFRYRIPVGVQGGAWPFRYEIRQGPSGASIGQFLGDADYGVVNWTPAAGESGTKTFSVRVTDQESNTLDITWTVTIDATPFVFVDARAGSSGTGTIDRPLKTFADWYRGSRTDARYRNRIIVFRAGRYDAYGEAATNGNVHLEAASKTPSLIGFPGETAVIDCSRAKFFLGGGLDDVFVAGLRFANARTDVANPHFFCAVGRSQRALWFENVFDNLQMGTANDDNPAAIFTTHVAQYRQHLLISNNRFERFTATGGNGAFIDLYTIEHGLIEGNRALDSQTSYGFWMKGTHAYMTLRNNQAYQNIGGMAFSIGLGVEADAAATPAAGPPHHHEVCWNDFVTAPNAKVGVVAMSAAYANRHHDTWLYRNTLSGEICWLRFHGRDRYHTDGNVVIRETTNPGLIGAHWAAAEQSVGIPNLEHVGPAAEIIDAQGRLVGTYRSRFLGIRGHEIPRVAPKPPSGLHLSGCHSFQLREGNRNA